MTRVVLVSFKFPPVYSGYGKQLKLVTDEIVKSNENISFTVLTAYKEPVVNQTTKIDIISMLNKKDDKNSRSVYNFSVEVFKWLVKNKNNYDVIHCVKAGPEAIACNIASKVLKKKLIVKVAQDELSDREITSATGIKKYVRLFRHKLLSSVNNIIAISEEIEDDVSKRVGKNTIVHRIPNGVDTTKFYPLPQKDKLELRSNMVFNKDDLILLYVGAINKRKGIDDFLKALELYQSDVKIKIVLCGPILENLDFEKRVTSLNQNNNLEIIYKGSVSNVDDYMKIADMFILPSYSEGLPNVLLEAASTGLPLIATNIGGSRDIVSDGENGFLVNTGSPKEINDKLTLLSENESYRKKFGEKSRHRVMQLFSLKSVSAEYIELYNQ